MAKAQTLSDGIVGAMALDIASDGSSTIATTLLSNAVEVQQHRIYNQGTHRYHLRLLLPLDYMDMLDDEASKAIVKAARRVDVSCSSVRQQLAPTAEGWRDRLAELEDWGPLDVVKDAWVVIEERLTELKALLSRAVTPDDLADVGRRCRELMIAAASATYRPSMLPEGKEPPKDGDAKTKCKYIVNSLGTGSVDERLTKLIDKAWDVSMGVTHHDEPPRIATFTVAQATILVVRTLARIEADLQSQSE